MSGEPGDFLSRWSRRKLEIRRAEEAPQPEAKHRADLEVPAGETDDGLSPEEIAALPKLEEITPDTDMTLFLRKGVPELLRKAALRRLWSVDPAIRDYVGDARDYAYDWNVPGGVPGNGPLLPTDDVEGMLDRLFGSRPDARSDPQPPARQPAGAASQSSEPEDEDENGAGRKGVAPDDGAPRQAIDQGPSGGAIGRTAIVADKGEAGLDATADPNAALPVSAPSEPAMRPRRRRHGSATPL